MLAYRAEFTWGSPAGPQKLDAVLCTALGADAYR